MWDKIRNQPVIIFSAVGAIIVAGAQSLAGHGVIGQDIVDTLVKAVGENGWLWAFLIPLVARWFAWGPVTVEKMTQPGNEPPPAE